MRKSSLPYLGALLLSVLAIVALLALGRHLHGGTAISALSPTAAAAHPLALMLLQITVVLIAARLTGRLFQHCGQPAVIGEIAAGLLLGPSALGLAWPELTAALFPVASLPPLQWLSQLGVLLFMFTVGTDIDLGELRHKARAAVVISHTSIVLPFALGVVLALAAFPLLAAPGVSFHAFALFMGIAMSITAFPVLARILQERGLSHTPLGRTAIACAAIDDVTAWCLLALVIALAQNSGMTQVVLTLVLTLAFVALMLVVVRPLLARWAARRLPAATHSDALSLSTALMILCAAAAATEAIGIHALFGAFMAGVVMPAMPAFRSALRERLQGFAAALLLPLFFALTGLRTQIGLIDGLQDWLLCGVIIVVAIAGKLGGGLLAARHTGSSWREAFMIGSLMNTRGLMELIVLNIGYDLGILSPRVFSMMVIMALVTTCMTGPLLSLAQRGQRKAAIDNGPQTAG